MDQERCDGVIPIQVDHREAASAVLPALRACPDFHVTLTHLPLGDYLVDGRFLFERKTIADLAVSIIAGRFFEQALRLARAAARSALILEGTGRDLAQSRMSRESIQGALVTATLFCGIPILRTRSPEETVSTMLFAARQGRTAAIGALPRGGYRPRGKRARQLFILQGVPGVGPRRARQLIERFGSVEGVMTATAEELSAVSGIGKHLAHKIRWAVEEMRGSYRVSPNADGPSMAVGG